LETEGILHVSSRTKKSEKRNFKVALTLRATWRRVAREERGGGKKKIKSAESSSTPEGEENVKKRAKADHPKKRPNGRRRRTRGIGGKG